MTHDKLITVLNRGGQHLGDMIWWTLSDAKIDRSTLENIWAGAQLAPDYLPDPPTAEKALKAAVREAAIGQPIDHVHFPQRAGTIQRRRVQCSHELVQGFPVRVTLAQLVVENVFGDVDGIGFLPMRHRGHREIDDAVERRPHVGEAEEFPIQVPGEGGGRLGRPLADLQAGHVLGAGFGLGDEKAEIE